MCTPLMSRIRQHIYILIFRQVYTRLLIARTSRTFKAKISVLFLRTCNVVEKNLIKNQLLVIEGAELNRVGVISDTHAYDLDELPEKVVSELGTMDMIVHAGDYTGKDLLDQLRKLGDFKGVYGNMDPPEIREELQQVIVFEFMGFRIGVAHPAEGGSPFRLMERVRERFDRIDVVIFGHSHWPKNEVRKGILFLNPGSVTGRFPARDKTFGILEINEEVKGIIKKV